MRMPIKAAVMAGLTFSLGSASYAACPANPLEMHAAFFDINHDGKVEYWETVASLKRLGVGYVEREKFAILLHTFVFFKNHGSDSAIAIAGIAKTGRHEGDTGIFNADGAFDPAAFQRFFERFDADRSGAINTTEVEAAIEANKKDRGAKARARPRSSSRSSSRSPGTGPTPSTERPSGRSAGNGCRISTKGRCFTRSSAIRSRLARRASGPRRSPPKGAARSRPTARS